MDERLRLWFEREIATWASLESAPQLLVPNERCLSPDLSSRLSDEEIDVEPPIDGDVLYEFPWDCEECDLIRMDWGSGMPGLSGGYAIFAVDVPRIARIYVEAGLEGWALLAASGAQVPPEVADLAFLDIALQSNGKAFDTGLMGSPPRSLFVAVGDHEWLAARLSVLFDEYDLWDELEEIPGVCESDDAELAELAAGAGVNLDALNEEYDARRPPEPRGSMVAMMAWSSGRDRWIREKLLDSQAAREWLCRKRMTRYLGVMSGEIDACQVSDE